MATFTAASIVRAAELRDAFGATAILQVDVSAAATTVAIDVPGLAVPVDPKSRYLIEGYLAFQAGPGTTDNPELSMGLTSPSDCEGDWCVWSLVDNTGNVNGNIANFRRTAFNEGTAAATIAGVGTGSGTIEAAPFAGRLRCFENGGVVQVRFAQLFSDASATTVKAGSWLRAQKIQGELPSW